LGLSTGDAHCTHLSFPRDYLNRVHYKKVNFFEKIIIILSVLSDGEGDSVSVDMSHYGSCQYSCESRPEMTHVSCSHGAFMG